MEEERDRRREEHEHAACMDNMLMQALTAVISISTERASRKSADADEDEDKV